MSAIGRYRVARERDHLLYRQPGPTSGLGHHAGLSSGLPTGPEALSAIVRGLLIRNFTAKVQRLPFPAERMSHMQAVGAEAILDNVHGDVHLMTDEIVEKLAIAIDAQRGVDLSDRRTREAVSRSLSLLRSRGVLYAGLDDESWVGVFMSLKDLRNSLAETSAELMPTGLESISSVLQLMTTALRDYLVTYEASFNSHMNYPSGNWDWHDQFTWPDLEAAGTDLLLLRRLLVAAIEPLNSYATAGEVVDWDPSSFYREEELRSKEL